MVTSRLSSFVICVVAIINNVACAAQQECPEINDTFKILNWSGSTPGKVVVVRYDAGSSYEIQLGGGFDYVGEIISRPDGSRTLVLTPRNDNSVAINPSENFKILIDGVIEYRVSDIVTGPQRLGCAVRSAKVNKCTAKASIVVAFDASCHQ